MAKPRNNNRLERQSLESTSLPMGTQNIIRLAELLQNNRAKPQQTSNPSPTPPKIGMHVVQAQQQREDVSRQGLCALMFRFCLSCDNPI